MINSYKKRGQHEYMVFLKSIFVIFWTEMIFQLNLMFIYDDKILPVLNSGNQKLPKFDLECLQPSRWTHRIFLMTSGTVKWNDFYFKEFPLVVF